MAKKQLAIPGTERRKIADINAAAEGYVDARDKRMKLTEKEVAAKDALIATMKQHKVDVYRDDDVDPPLVVTLKPGKDGVRVEQLEAEEESDDDAGGAKAAE